MRGDPEVLEALNEILKAELTAINQYFIHSKINDNYGYKRLAKHKHDESIEEMRHAEKLIERILYLEGKAAMDQLNPMTIKADIAAQHQSDLALERQAVARLNKAIALCRKKSDNGTRALLESMLADEEEAVDWLEAQLEIIEQIGKERYLAEHIHES